LERKEEREKEVLKTILGARKRERNERAIDTFERVEYSKAKERERDCNHIAVSLTSYL